MERDEIPVSIARYKKQREAEFRQFHHVVTFRVRRPDDIEPTKYGIEHFEPDDIEAYLQAAAVRAVWDMAEAEGMDIVVGQDSNIVEFVPKGEK